MKTLYHVSLPKYMDEKIGLLYVRTPNVSMIHQSWEINEGRIIVFETNLEDYPANAFLFLMI